MSARATNIVTAAIIVGMAAIISSKDMAGPEMRAAEPSTPPPAVLAMASLER